MSSDNAGARRLAIEVVYRAVQDLYVDIPAIREDAEQFLRSDTFWLEAAGLDVKMVREMIPELLKNADKCRREKVDRRTAKKPKALHQHQLQATGG